ncbi:hypothetical protein ACFY2R_18330 [Micromonospora olivasterospora]|uniref:hypothetical protein n=1 Tax=Micromonospora olivasterospora TaxID=1880 RepID=UPI001FE4B9DB|nr:hypothetical protein [Micromonospora olivasterospora]
MVDELERSVEDAGAPRDVLRAPAISTRQLTLPGAESGATKARASTPSRAIEHCSNAVSRDANPIAVDKPSRP